MDLKSFQKEIKSPFVWLLIILCLASFLRLWHLDSVPPGLYPDEAINGNEAFFSLNNHSFHIFYPENNGREGLYINLLGFTFCLIGPSIFAIRLISALLGILTIVVIFFLGKELFNKKVGLISSALISFSFWHLNLSRLGFRAILVPLILTLALYFLFRGIRLQKFYYFLLSGFFWGLGFYSYTVFRLAYFLLLIIFIFYLWQQRGQRLKLFKEFFFLGLTCLIIMMPIFIYFLSYPEYFFSRAVGVSIFS